METRIQVKDVAAKFRSKIPANSLTAFPWCYFREPDSDIIEVDDTCYVLLKPLAEANPLDELYLSSNKQSLNIFEVQQKDDKIRATTRLPSGLGEKENNHTLISCRTAEHSKQLID